MSGEYILHSRYSPLATQIGFQLPIFHDGTRCFCQLISPDAYVVTFIPIDEPAIGPSLISSDPCPVVEAGEPALFVIATPDRRAVMGPKDKLAPYIRSHINQFRAWPSVYFEFARFIGDKTLVNEAIDALTSHYRLSAGDALARELVVAAENDFNFNSATEFDQVLYRPSVFSDLKKTGLSPLQAMQAVKNGLGAKVAEGERRFASWVLKEAAIDISNGGTHFKAIYFIIYFEDRYSGLRIVESCDLNPASVSKYKLDQPWRRLERSLIDAAAFAMF